ncbi:hypothetical protein [Amycolatopsis sp. NPDC051071]|uniref:hypothetical protein n=1 Tax=Amycolatopsis sp. NPDC051071 TaxID=3154637 RepID=UPI003434CAA6
MSKIVATGVALVLVLILLIGGGAIAVVQAVFGSTGSGLNCAPGGVTSTAAGYGPQEMTHAATIVAVGKRMHVPEHGWVVAITTALTQSRLQNLDHGDRDSLGLFQQRPSMGWGTPDQIMDPSYSSEHFYRHLLEIPNWQNIPVTEAAQLVQRSGFPDRYTQFEDAARQIVAVAQGSTCAPRTTGQLRTNWPPEQATMPDPTSGGQITPRTLTLVQTLRANGMTGNGLGCFAHRPANPNSDHPQGRACDIMFNSHSQPSVTEGSQIANWLIAHQADLGIRYLIWQSQYWSADNPTWSAYQSRSYGCPNPNNLTGCHYDHIHVSMY